MSKKSKGEPKAKFQSSAQLSVLDIPPGAEPIKPVYLCPFCKVRTTFEPVGWTLNHWIAKCDNCCKQFFAKVKYTGTVYGTDGKTRIKFEVIETYPKTVEERHEAIPEHIWNDFFEALKDYEIKSFKSTVVMCRRTMQNICLDKGATKKDASGSWINLRNQIKQAFAGAEYEFLRGLSEEIKYFGDYGAHPQEDEIDEVIEEEAKDILEFTKSFIEIIYIQPYRVKKRFEKRT